MKVEWMRKIDRHVGRPLVYFLSFFIRNRDMLPECDIKTIVVAKYFGIGSITLSTPLLQAIRERFPSAQIVFLTFNNNTELLKLFPFISEVISIRNDTLSHFIYDTLKAIMKLRMESKPEIFLDIEFFSHYSSLMAWLSGARSRVGFHTSLLPRGRILTHRVSFNSHRYITEAFSALGQKIGANKEFGLFKPVLDMSYRDAVSDWLRHIGIVKDQYIVINTRSTDHLGELKKWPDDKWASLITKIVFSLRFPIILTGLRGDRSAVDQVRALLPDSVFTVVHNTAGEFSLGEFLAVLQMSRFLITIDSGPLHLSQMLDVPCIALFGPETPVLYGPRRKFDRTVYANLYCSPCCNVLEGKQAECTNPHYKECMESIDINNVWSEILILNDLLRQ